jgi:hypothetical protein
MTLTHAETRTEYTFTVAGAEPVPALYIEARIVPSAVAVEFVNGKFNNLTVFGHRAKKDGTAEIAPLSSQFSPDDLTTLPEWAQALSDHDNVARLAKES